MPPRTIREGDEIYEEILVKLGEAQNLIKDSKKSLEKVKSDQRKFFENTIKQLKKELEKAEESKSQHEKLKNENNILRVQKNQILTNWMRMNTLVNGDMVSFYHFNDLNGILSITDYRFMLVVSVFRLERELLCLYQQIYLLSAISRKKFETQCIGCCLSVLTG